MECSRNHLIHRQGRWTQAPKPTLLLTTINILVCEIDKENVIRESCKLSNSVRSTSYSSAQVIKCLCCEKFREHGTVHFGLADIWAWKGSCLFHTIFSCKSMYHVAYDLERAAESQVTIPELKWSVYHRDQLTKQSYLDLSPKYKPAAACNWAHRSICFLR